MTRRWVAGEDRHTKAVRNCCNLPADCTGANNADCFTTQLKPGRATRCVIAERHLAADGIKAAAQCQEQHDSMLRNRRAAIVGYVDNGNIAIRRVV